MTASTLAHTEGLFPSGAPGRAGGLQGHWLANRSAPGRDSADFYPTPPEVTWALLEHLDLPVGTRIWEPACGQGHMAEVLIEAGHQVQASDLFDTGYGQGGVDFLEPSGTRDVDWVITNPPFKHAEAFIERCLDLQVRFAMLLKSQFWHSARRRALFARHCPQWVLPLTWRPNFNPAQGNAPTMDVAWTVWDIEPATGCLYAPLVRPGTIPSGPTLFEVA